MSRIGMKPIEIPEGVDVKIDKANVSTKGSKGELSLTLPDGISATMRDNLIVVTRLDDSSTSKSLHGLGRSLIANMVTGVSKGYLKELQLEGVGYRANLEGNKLVLSLGFSSPSEYVLPDGITANVNGTDVSITGPDKQLVGNVAAEIRALHPPEPYKGKGVRYKGEHVRRKTGKTVA